MIEKIIAENLGINQDSIKDISDFKKDLGADSLNLVEVVLAIEEEFDIEIPDEDVETIFTVGELKQYIEDNS